MPACVKKEDIGKAFAELGVREGDIVLVHSSLKSLGFLENGPDTVIRGIESLIGKEGTLVMPTLCSVDFMNSYKTWYMDKPSDVGYLTEYFRKLPYVYRSNHATHSVAARGKKAYELTYEHGARGPHLCPFGEYAFADSSPWNKLYQADAHIVFLGVDLMYNTMKHMIEASFTEWLLEKVKDEEKVTYLKSKLRKFETFDDGGIWPFYSAPKMEEALETAGLITHTKCGQAELKRISAKESSDFALEELKNHHENYVSQMTMDWIKECLE